MPARCAGGRLTTSSTPTRDRGTHLRAKVAAAQAVQEEVDDIIGCGKDVGQAPEHVEAHLQARQQVRPQVLSVGVEVVGDSVRQAHEDEGQADGHQHTGQLTLSGRGRCYLGNTS